MSKFPHLREGGQIARWRFIGDILLHPRKISAIVVNEEFLGEEIVEKIKNIPQIKNNSIAVIDIKEAILENMLLFEVRKSHDRYNLYGEGIVAPDIIQENLSEDLSERYAVLKDGDIVRIAALNLLAYGWTSIEGKEKWLNYIKTSGPQGNLNRIYSRSLITKDASK